jgi:energy-converting hydrogenase Eha subunit B
MSVTMERVLAWKLLPRIVMGVLCWQYVTVLEWYMAIPQSEVSTQATALTSVVTGALSGAYAVWLGHEK